MQQMRRMLSVTVISLLSVFFFSESMTAKAERLIYAEIPVSCFDISDSSAHVDDSHIYELKIEPETQDSPVPDADTLLIAEQETACFEIPVTEAGTFRYKIYEIEGTEPDIKYDDTVYHITLFVENGSDDTVLYAVSVVAGNKDKKISQINFQDDLLFDNYNQSSDIPVTVPETVMTTTTSSPALSPDYEKMTTSSVQTVTETTSNTVVIRTQSESVPTPKRVTELISSVLTGDSFPVYAVGIVVIASLLTAIFTFLFKPNHSEEEDKNDN